MRRVRRSFVLVLALMSLVGALFSGTAEATASGSYVPMSPSRLLDTRSGLGAPKAAVAGNHVVDLQVTGRGGVPASGVGAVVLNVTAVGPTSAGNLTVFPAGQVRPNTSNLNFVAGQTVANLVIVKVGTGGKVSLVTSGGQTNLIGDVMGWYPTGSEYAGLSPSRLLDTRSGLGAPKAAVAGNHVVDLQVTGRGGVPASGVGAVVLNVT
ncbi:hypothetical protein, partial [Terrabacter ginsenosidimutans]|uniref:hypothetical protein n=1 Tax=Terrabacter ginsenosidimutans TaxID=490575 RepID=UPI0031EE677E